MRPDFSIEKTKNCSVIGIDEAGRGPLAGPVVAAAIILDERALEFGINDSKKLSETKREKLYDLLTNNYQFAVSIVEPEKIDEVNILQATMLAMRLCIDKMDNQNSFILIDGNKTPIVSPNIECVIGGDAKSITIAAASIIAKVERDRIMQNLAKEFPQYNWEKNKGYGTKDHIENLRKHGPSLHHRRTFIKNFVE